MSTGPTTGHWALSRTLAVLIMFLMHKGADTHYNPVQLTWAEYN